MKKVITLVFAAVMMTSFAAAQAGSTAQGTLTVNATVSGSISLVFVSHPGGVALTSGDNTNTATFDFGSVSAFGQLASTSIGRTVNQGAQTFTVSAAVDVVVNKFNSNSANYRLAANLVTPDAVNLWSVGNVGIVNGTANLITSTGAYGTNNPLPVAITIPFSTPSGTLITNQINYAATSN